MEKSKNVSPDKEGVRIGMSKCTKILLSFGQYCSLLNDNTAVITGEHNSCDLAKAYIGNA